MWQTFFFWIKQLVFAGQELQAARAEIKQMQIEAKETTAIMVQMLNELRRLRENDDRLLQRIETLRSDETHEREKTLLRLENELLKFERRLPPPQNRRSEE